MLGVSQDLAFLGSSVVLARLDNQPSWASAGAGSRLGYERNRPLLGFEKGPTPILLPGLQADDSARPDLSGSG